MQFVFCDGNKAGLLKRQLLSPFRGEREKVSQTLLDPTLNCYFVVCLSGIEVIEDKLINSILDIEMCGHSKSVTPLEKLVLIFVDQQKPIFGISTLSETLIPGSSN